MVQRPSWEDNRFSPGQEFPRISRNPKFHYRTYKPPPPVLILDQPNPVLIPTSHLLKIHPNIIHPSFSLRFPPKNPLNHLSSPMRVKCWVHLILLDFITRTICVEVYRPKIMILNSNISDCTLKCVRTALLKNINNYLNYTYKIRVCDFNLCTKQGNKQSWTKILWHDTVRWVFYFALSLPTDTAVLLRHAEDRLLRNENCSGQLKIQRKVPAIVRKEYQNCDRLW